jgi:hypothetical protein
MLFHVFSTFLSFVWSAFSRERLSQGNSHTTNSANTTPRMKGSVENLDYVWIWMLMISHDAWMMDDDGANMCKITSSKRA